MLKQLKPYLKNLADALRNWSKTSEKINAQDFPIVVQWVYDNGWSEGYENGYDEGEETGFTDGYNIGENDGYILGEQAEYDRFWDAYQMNGRRGSYQYGFCLFDDETFKPKYDINLAAGYTGTSMFWGCGVTNIAAALEQQGVVLDTTNCGYMSGMFQNARSVRIPILNCTHAHDYDSSYGLQNVFNGAKAETIDKLIVTERLKYSNTFVNCTNLKNIVFEGIIGNNIAFGQSPLSEESIRSVVNALSETVTGKTLTLKKSAVNEAFGIDVDDESTFPAGTEYYILRHSKDNWTFSYV